MNPFWLLMAGLGFCALAIVAMIAAVAMNAMPVWLVGSTVGSVALAMACALVAVFALGREDCPHE